MFGMCLVIFKDDPFFHDLQVYFPFRADLCANRFAVITQALIGAMLLWQVDAPLITQLGVKVNEFLKTIKAKY